MSEQILQMATENYLLNWCKRLRTETEGQLTGQQIHRNKGLIGKHPGSKALRKLYSAGFWMAIQKAGLIMH